MKEFIGISAVVALLATAGVAIAQPQGKMRGDRDGDGAVTRSALSASLDTRFARMDANGDGVLNQADRAAKRAEIFAKIDSDGNGSISQAEWDAMAAKRGERRMGANEGQRGGKRAGKRGGRGMAMMKRADTNGDGAISKDEFRTAALARFDKMDSNRDGTISPQERQAARAAWREQKGG
ncbi:MAG: EF-hand domain-containing protein [Parasphingorhabdus sp.]|nr:EF-hand domain-containing protein [Parasphingorhabdus sp.]